MKKEDQLSGNIPFVMAGVTNTGVINYISNPVASFPKNSITVDIFGNTFYRDYDFPTVEEAIKQIHACGGKAVLAHPGKYYKNSTMDEVVADFEKLVDSHLDGIECYYPIHSEELTKCCVDFCNAHDLMITVGCDCHGEMSKKDGEYVMGCIQKDESELVLKF